VVRAILALIRPERRVLAIATVVGLLASAAGLAEPLVAKAVIEALSDDRSLLDPVFVLGGLTIVAAVISAMCIWLFVTARPSAATCATSTASSACAGRASGRGRPRNPRGPTWGDGRSDLFIVAHGPGSDPDRDRVRPSSSSDQRPRPRRRRDAAVVHRLDRSIRSAAGGSR
jgi:hypothetical protein